MNGPGIADPQNNLLLLGRRRGISRGIVALVLAAIAAAAIAFTVLPTIITHPSFVSSLNVKNESDYDIQVSVGKGGGESVVSLGQAGQQCTTTFSQVADQGDSWELRFRTQGVDGGAVTVTRQSLEDGGWTVTIPPEVAQSFKDKGVALPPRRDCGTATNP
jgi:hypothetical protein